MLVSLQPPMGGMYFSSAVETVIATVDTWTKSLGTTTSTGLTSFTMPTNNRLLFTGVSPRHMHIACSMSMIAAGNNKVLEFGIYHWDASAGSGSMVESSKLQRKVGTGLDVGALALHCDVLLDENDFLEMHVMNTTDAVNLTLTHAYLFAMGMIV